MSAPARSQSEPQAPTSKPASQDVASIASDAAKPAAKPPTVRPKHVAPEQLTGAQSVVRSLEELDVDTVFGIPGGAVLPVYDPLFDSKKVRHVLVRHEQGAGHAATGYAQATGRVGVCMATSGPGATNLVTPLADAQMDSVPIVAITGQVGRSADRHRRLPGSRHLRHHHADHQAQLPDHRRRSTSRACWPRRSTGLDRPARRGARGHPQGRAASARPRSPGRRRCGCPATAR